MFEAFKLSFLPAKLVTNVLQFGFAFGSGRIDQFAFKLSDSISHLLSFSLPYISNPTWATHIQGVAFEN
ncbi:hypothetical protein ACFX5Q_32655 [Mesorhizobium sp. IMUNJ 23033]|uniref:hypothetical protein n=1 Tax=Mesorhizobium sp. IMUNJ 23033 TaxID=3378039 RepID=UPI003850E795